MNRKPKPFAGNLINVYGIAYNDRAGYQHWTARNPITGKYIYTLAYARKTIEQMHRVMYLENPRIEPGYYQEPTQ